MSVPRGNERQYFSNELSGNEVSQGILEVTNALNNSLNGVQNIANSAWETRLTNNQIDLANQFMIKNNEINTKYQQDPTNPNREVELNEAFESLAAKYKVNPLVESKWKQIKNDIYNNYKQYNAKWQLEQQQTNASIDLKNSYENSIKQAGMLGANNASIDEVRLIYANCEQALNNGVSAKQLGGVYTQEALKGLKHDFMSKYLEGLAQDNPQEVLNLINNDSSGVLNDIGDIDTISKLKQFAQQKLIKKSEVDAVDRIASYINTNHELFQKAFDGTLNLDEAQQILNNPDVDRNMRNIISSMLGYNTSSDLYVNSETGEILSKEKSKNSDNGDDNRINELVIGNKKWNFVTSKGKKREPNAQEKDEIRNELYLRGSQLLNDVEGKTPQQAIRSIAEFQSQIAQASYFGLSNSDYNKLMNTFVLPATKDIQEQAKKYNANISSWRPSDKYGYQQIDKYFDKLAENLEDTESNRNLLNNEKALASVYYWAGLNSYCSSRGISMNDLFGLTREERGEIYNKAATNAINKAKATTQAPELWFRSMNPQYVSYIRNCLPNTQANNVITNVAISALSNPNMTDKDYDNIIDKEIRKEFAALRTSNKATAFGNNTKYDEIINQYSMKYGIDPLLIKCVIKQESGFKNDATSTKGAQGLMQLMPATARGLGCKNPLDPKQNIEAGTRYLRQMLDKFNGNIPLALAAYNSGPGNVEKAGNKIPNIKETRNYVANIMAMYNKVRG